MSDTDNGPTGIETRVESLEREITELRRIQDRLFTVIDVSTPKEPFIRLILSLSATETQEAAVYDLMSELDVQITAKRSAMDHVEFCSRVQKIFPGQQPRQLSETIVTRLAPDGAWDQVYQHLRESGMNLPDLRETRGF